VVLPAKTSRRDLEHVWRLEVHVPSTSTDAATAERALEAARAALQPAVVTVPLCGSACHVVGRRGRAIRGLPHSLARDAERSVAPATFSASVDVEVTSGAVRATVLVLPAGEEAFDSAAAHALAAKRVRAALSAWVQLRFESARESVWRRIEGVVEDSQVFDQVCELAKERREVKRERDALRKGRRTRRLQAKTVRAARVARRSATGNPQRSSSVASRRSSRAWAIEDVEECDLLANAIARRKL